MCFYVLRRRGIICHRVGCVATVAAQVKRKGRADKKKEERIVGQRKDRGGPGAAVSVSSTFPLSVLDASDGLDLRGLAVGAPVLPVLVVSAVSLALHDVLLASVARELVAHKAEGDPEGLGRLGAVVKEEIPF